MTTQRGHGPTGAFQGAPGDVPQNSIAAPNLAQLALLDAIADGLQVGDATGPEARIIAECAEASWIAWNAEDKVWTLTDAGWSAIAQRGGAQE